MKVRVLGFLARWLYAIIHRTVRVVISSDGAEIVSVFGSSERIIMAFWHGQLAMVYAGYSGPGACVPISRHRDGEIITRAIAPYGVRAARGSSTRGSVASLRALLTAFREGCDLAITPDGPRGPRHQAKAGVIDLAKVTGARVFPVACAAEWRIVFGKSWDRFTVPIPFSRVHYAVGEPLTVPRDVSQSDREALRDRLEAELVRLTELAEGRAGRTGDGAASR